MQVINNYIILKRLVNQQTSTGIFLNEKNDSPFGIVEAVDSSIKNIKKGDQVLFKKDRIINFNHDNNTYIACPYEDIIVILNEKN